MTILATRNSHRLLRFASLFLLCTLADRLPAQTEATLLNNLVDFNFPERIEQIVPGEVTMQVNAYKAKQFSQILDLDLDGVLTDPDMDRKSFVTFMKSSIRYRNRNFSDFTPEFVLSREYVRKAFTNCNILKISEPESLVTAFRQVKILVFSTSFEFDARFYFHDNFEDFMAENVPPQQDKKWRELALFEGRYPDWVSTVQARKEDVRPNKRTAGGRTTNFYYELAENKVLHISYKLASFRKTPHFAISRIVSGQRQETEQALKGIDRM